jgi:sarcosine oxidase subunit gamma
MAADLTVTGPAMRAVFDIRLRVASPALPPWPGRPNSRTTAGERALLWLGPDRWLLLAPLHEETALHAALAQDGITLWSDSLAFFTLTGPGADAAMAIACPLDLHPRAFAADAASWTDAFGTRALVLRDGAGWLLAVEPSYADYIAAHLRQIG